jgi:hypothetical protein
MLQSTLERRCESRWAMPLEFRLALPHVALRSQTGTTHMKATGFLLLCAGFAIVFCTFLLLPTGAPRGAFVLAGIAVQALGLVLVFRAHMPLDEEL